MEYVEKAAMTSFHTPPSLWIRYVDDTFCIIKKPNITNFHKHINSIWSHIQFTKEEEIDKDIKSKLKDRGGGVISENQSQETDVSKEIQYDDSIFTEDDQLLANSMLSLDKKASTHL